MNEQVNELCSSVGRYMLREAGQASAVRISTTKGLHDYVTHVDRESEKRLVDGL